MHFPADLQIIQWRSVKAVASNDLSRVIGLIPLAGYLILFNDEIARFASFDTIAGVSDEDLSPFFLEAVPKLRLVFFGSLFVLFSYVIYMIYRPRVLDRFGDGVEFAARVYESFSVKEIARIEAQVFAETWIPRESTFWIMLGNRRKSAVLAGYRPDVRSNMFGKHGDYIHLLAREWWAGMMHVSRWARIASLVFGITGYVLLAVPAIDIAQAVFRDMVPGD
jgi:hypothetical protein